jgi:hypothetical protein
LQLSTCNLQQIWEVSALARLRHYSPLSFSA